MKIVFLVAASLMFALSSSAQITATLTASRGGSAVSVKNDSALPLSAIALRVQGELRGDWPKEVIEMVKGPTRIYLDSLMDPSVQPLAAHEERILEHKSLILPADPRVRIEPEIGAAGIFADGSTTGEPSLLTLLLLRRSNMLLAADTAIDILSDAAKHNVPPSWLTGQFRRLSLSHFYLLPEQEAGRALYESVLEKLVNLPAAPLGAPFPPTEFAEHETAELRQLRAALVDSRPNLEQVAKLR